jgi:DNA-binding response OmpR family regulator
MPAGELNRSILVIEDEAMVSMLLENMVLDWGGRIVWPVATFDQGLAVAREAEFDVAILDLNLNGTLSYLIAEVIRCRGILVIFATGYGGAGLPERF